MQTRTTFALLATLAFTACVDSGTDGTDDSGWDAVGGKADGTALSYGELAASKVPPALAAVEDGLEIIDDDVMPEEPKAVRKQIAALRDQVDLFVYAYPDGHGDRWSDIRDELDEGYETIGHFKDLFDRQGIEDPALAAYDDEELTELRGEVVTWTEHFLATARRSRDDAYLMAPAPSKLYDRDHDDLSPYFWGATSIEPAKTKSGLKNMANLTRKLLDQAEDDYADVLDVRDLHKERNQAQFHSFRKRVRSIARLVGYFPEIVKPGHDLTAQIAIFDETVDRYGALNDELTRYFAHPDDDLKAQISDEWMALRDWQKDQHLDDVLEDVHDAIRN